MRAPFKGFHQLFSSPCPVWIHPSQEAVTKSTCIIPVEAPPVVFPQSSVEKPHLVCYMPLTFHSFTSGRVDRPDDTCFNPPVAFNCRAPSLQDKSLQALQCMTLHPALYYQREVTFSKHSRIWLQNLLQLHKPLSLQIKETSEQKYIYLCISFFSPPFHW